VWLVFAPDGVAGATPALRDPSLPCGGQSHGHVLEPVLPAGPHFGGDCEETEAVSSKRCASWLVMRWLSPAWL